MRAEHRIPAIIKWLNSRATKWRQMEAARSSPIAWLAFPNDTSMKPFSGDPWAGSTVICHTKAIEPAWIAPKSSARSRICQTTNSIPISRRIVRRFYRMHRMANHNSRTQHALQYGADENSFSFVCTKSWLALVFFWCPSSTAAADCFDIPNANTSFACILCERVFFSRFLASPERSLIREILCSSI